jgi:hypothetical protein
LLLLVTLLELIHDIVEDGIDPADPGMSCHLDLVLKVCTRLLVCLGQLEPINQESHALFIELDYVSCNHKSSQIDKGVRILSQDVIGLTALVFEELHRQILLLLLLIMITLF